MTELSLENFLTIQMAFSAGLGVVLGALHRKIGDLCERITREETKSEIYHPDGTKR